MSQPFQSSWARNPSSAYTAGEPFPPLWNSTLMSRPIDGDGTCRYSTGRPGRENAPAVAAPPARPIRPGRATAAAAPTKSRRPQARIFSLTSVIPAPLVDRWVVLSAGIYRVNTSNVDWDAVSSRSGIGFRREFRIPEVGGAQRSRSGTHHPPFVARQAKRPGSGPTLGGVGQRNSGPTLSRTQR